MKTKSTSRSAPARRSLGEGGFFNSRVLIGFALCSVGLLLALAGLSSSVTGMIAVTGAVNPVPLIDRPLVPDAVAPGGAGFTLTVNGTGFVSGSVVNWNGIARATAFVNGSQLTAAILASDIATANTASLAVVSPSPGGGNSNVAFFEINHPTPTIELSKSDITLGTFVERETIGDFDADDKLDLAVSDPAGVFIMLGNGDGTFRAPVIQSVPGGIGYSITGDFDGDGKLDLAGLGSGIIAILLGNGDGTFQPHVDSAINTSFYPPFSLAGGDFNMDGKLDLVVCYQGDGTVVSLLLGNGDGTFQPFIDYATAPQSNAAAVGDFNGDGKLDLATANFGTFSGNTVSILLGNGDGTFQPHGDFPTDSGPLSIVAADFNGDDKLDLAVDCSCGHSSICGRPGTVSILLGNGDGTFRAPVNYNADEFPYTVIAGDLNADGKLDLALTNLDSGNLSILLGNGDGTFQPHFELTTNARPVGLVTGDFNRDGRLDFVVGGTSPAVVEIMLQVPTSAVVVPTFGNISTRVSVGSCDNVLIGGFIVAGTQPKKVIMRAIGPSLSAFGVSGALADPLLELLDFKGAAITTNDNWQESPDRQAIIDTGIPPTNDHESAILVALNPGAYMAVVSGANNGLGVGLVEVYDLDQTVDSKLANISTRGLVQTDDNVMIGGLIVLGTEPTKTVVRAIGPSMPVPRPLSDPTLELRDGNGAIFASNDNWKDSQQAEIEATSLAPTSDLESAIVATLSPGAYTAIVGGKDNTTGVALVEAYQLDH